MIIIISFFVIIVTADKPEITGIQEVRVMRLNTYINLTSSSKTSLVYTIIIFIDQLFMIGEGNSALIPPHPLNLIPLVLSQKLLPCVTAHSASHDTNAKSKESLTFCQFLIYYFFDERICYSGKSMLKLVGEEYPYVDSINLLC